jgi:hypothetical protein
MVLTVTKRLHWVRAGNLVAPRGVFMSEYAYARQPSQTRGRHVMTSREVALRRRRMNRKIRETLALRRFTATDPVQSAEATPQSSITPPPGADKGGVE